MAQRLAWLPLLVVGLAGLPGCNTFFGKILPCESCDKLLPPDPKLVGQVGTVEDEDYPKSDLKDAAPDGPDVSARAKPGEHEPGTGDVRPAQYATNPDTKPEAPPRAAKYAPLVEALQCVLDERHQEALQHLQGYDHETQEFYLRALPTLTIFARKKLDELSADEVTVLDDQLHSLLAQLRPRTKLVIERACFCEWTKSFGIYKPLPDNYGFLAATPDRPGEFVPIYVEMRNFASELRDGFYETRLRHSIELRDAKGEKVLKVLAPEDVPLTRRSRSRVNDLAEVYGFHVTADIPPGTYQLVVQIADETVPERRRVARKSLEFRVTPVVARTSAR